MSISMYEWVYIVTGIFGTYTVYRYMEVFFDIRKTSRFVEFLTYVAYYLFITVIYLIANIPVVLILGNLVSFFLLTRNYESTVRKRILATVLTYFILMIVELIAVVPFGGLFLNLFLENKYFSIYALIVCRILSFLVAVVLKNFKNIKKGEAVPNSYWISIILIPAASLYIILLLFQAEGLTSDRVFIGVTVLFFVNFVTFYLYDAIAAALSEKMQNLLVLEQNKYYDRQLEMIKTSLQTTDAIRHDLKNHMLSIRALVESGDTEESLNYISNILDDIGTHRNYSATGNTVIDSIINFKLQEAEHRNIRSNLDLNIPEHLSIPSFDMTIILGNLLDNAIRAAYKVADSSLNIRLSYDKCRLLIQVDNPYLGEICEKDGELVTTDDDKENHGIGLRNVKKVIRKYDGTMTINYGNGIFSISVLLYLD